jgi:hypothetical protein
MTTFAPATSGLPVLSVPEVPAWGHGQGSGAVAFTAGHHFALDGHADPGALGEAAAVPLSVILQVTKRCDFNCAPSSPTPSPAPPFQT